MKKVPKLRFTPTDGGEFPDWEEKTFGELVDNKSQKYNPLTCQTNYKCWKKGLMQQMFV